MTNRTVILAGATGLVGREILQGLLDDPGVACVHCLGRRAPAVQHAKLQAHIVDFAKLPALPAAQEVYLALGTTIKVAGSQQAFRALDFDANLAVARAALAAGARQAGLVSALGAKATSSVFYNRVKGELEDALSALPFAGLVIARPSLLAGERQSLGQAERRGEKLGLMLSNALGALIPRNYRPIQATRVAQALLRHTPGAHGRLVLESGQMQAD